MEIKDCPCCGFHEGALKETELGFKVECESCGLQTAEFHTENIAVQTWNKRSEYVKRGSHESV